MCLQGLWRGRSGGGGGGDTSGLLMLSPLPHRWEVLLNVSGHVGALRKAVDTEVNGERQVL